MIYLLLSGLVIAYPDFMATETAYVGFKYLVNRFQMH